MVFQSAALFDSLTVANVGFKLYEHSDCRTRRSRSASTRASSPSASPAWRTGTRRSSARRSALRSRAIIEETADGIDSKRDGAGAAAGWRRW